MQPQLRDHPVSDFPTIAKVFIVQLIVSESLATVLRQAHECVAGFNKDTRTVERISSLGCLLSKLGEESNHEAPDLFLPTVDY
jgi:hypothetical protein